MPDVILPDGRMIKTIEITLPRPPPLQPVTVSKNLLLDTGGFTKIPLANVAPYLGVVAIGAMVGSNLGTQFELIGATMNVSVTDHKGQNAENRSCSKIRVHLQSDGQFLGIPGCDGLLGMDQFNTLKADPAVSLTGEVIRLVKRE